MSISYKEEIEYERRAKEEKEWRLNEFVDAWIRRNKAFERMKQRAQEELANTYPEDEESF
jgi:chromatin segregation and condensation protein Rec8/ScpA/Scc1 (kleisin family)